MKFHDDLRDRRTEFLATLNEQEPNEETEKQIIEEAVEFVTDIAIDISESLRRIAHALEVGNRK